MGLTTERKVFFGLACVAGLALVIDQGVLGPKEAAADSLLELAISAPGPEAATTPITNSPKPTAMILMDRLSSIGSSDQGESFGSSFSLTRLIKPQVVPVAEGTQDGSVDQDQSASNHFPLIEQVPDDLPSLTAAMPAANGGGAVIGGKLVRVGQVGPNGYRLILVDARTVLVERDGVEYSIEIPISSAQN